MTEVLERAADIQLQEIESEAEDSDSQPSTYDVVTYPADWTLEVLVHKIESEDILIPGYQRKYVWSIKQASRLIESFLLGLPVPAVFLYTEPETGKLLVVDGQQRLWSIAQYFGGDFGSEKRGKKTVFRLTGLNERSPYLGKAYADLEATDEGSFNRLKNSVLRAFIIKQLRPEDHSCVFHVFERLNTGGTQLVGQEIRNCVYHGPFNDMLIKLNRLPEWREILGRRGEDKRQRDVELVLRFFALHDEARTYAKPMKEFLNRYTKRHQFDTGLERYEELFSTTTRRVLKALGGKPFHVRAGLNAAVFDAVYVAFARRDGTAPADIQGRYKALVSDPDFVAMVSMSTTDESVVRKRLRMAGTVLFGG